MIDPAWTVIVPTYNRPRQLARCLDALSLLRPPAGGFEILIVNDGGTAESEDVRHAAGLARTVRWTTQAHAGPAVARNTGARMAAGTWLAFTDDDCEPAPGWLLAFEQVLTRRPEMLAGGPVRNALSDRMFSEASQRLVDFVVAWFDGKERERFFTSNNIALARDAFLDAGGFDPAYGSSAGEDREFCDRWTSLGRDSILVADAFVDHRHELSLRSFLRQHYSYGRGAELFRHQRRAAGRAIGIDAGFYIASLRHAARSRPIARGLTLAGCTALAHAAYGAGLLRESWRPRTRPPARTAQS